LATEKQVNFEDIYTEGITGITKTDIDYSKKIGKSLKLVATAGITDKGVWARVCPLLLEPTNPLSGVSDVFNAIKLTGNMLGDVMFYGQGAGKLPTAAAVVSDIVDAIRHKNINLGIHWSEEVQPLLSLDDVVTKKFVRVAFDAAENSDKAINAVKNIFGEVQTVNGVVEDEFAFITNADTEKNLNEKINALLNSDGVSDIPSTIRVEYR
jgi:homoserine dehydrogenase